MNRLKFILILFLACLCFSSIFVAQTQIKKEHKLDKVKDSEENSIIQSRITINTARPVDRVLPDSQDLIENIDCESEINWTQGYIQGSGRCEPVKIKGCRLDCRKTVFAIADKNLWKATLSLRVNNELTVLDLINESDETKARFESFVRKDADADIEHLTEGFGFSSRHGSYYSTASLDLAGMFTELILQNIPSPKNLSEKKHNSKKPLRRKKASEVYTELIIDARGLFGSAILIPLYLR